MIKTIKNDFLKIITFVLLLISSLSIFYFDYILPDIDIILPYILIIFIGVWFLGNKSGFFFFILNNTLWITSKIYYMLKPGLNVYSDIIIKFTFILIQYLIIIKLKKYYHEVRELALKDELTGLYNRRGFYYLLDYLLIRLNREQKTVTLIYIDIDNFKTENDKKGHREGDSILRNLGEIITTTTREADIAARVGGDEFCIFIYDTEHAEIRNIVDRISEHFNKVSADHGWITTLSIGVFSTNHSIPINDLIEHSDTLMYRAKNEGKRKIVFDVL